MKRKQLFVFGLRGLPNIQGGVERHCESLYKRLTDREYQITIFTRKPFLRDNLDLKEWNGLKLINLWSPKIKGVETLVHSFLCAVICIFKRPDLIHIHNIGPGIVTPLLKVMGLKVLLTYHSINYHQKKWGPCAKTILKLSEYLSLKFAERIIVVSEHIERFIKTKHKKLNIKFIPNGIEAPRFFNSCDDINKYGLTPKDYILTVSRISPEKGLDILVQAYNKMNTSTRLVIAGDVDNKTNYARKLFELASKNKNIVFTGFISGKTLYEFYSHAKLFVLPSYHEGMSLVLLEAMSYNLPILASDIEANRELGIRSSECFKSGDVADLVKKLKVKLSGISLQRYEEKGRIIEIGEKYNWDRVAREVAAVYNDLI